MMLMTSEAMIHKLPDEQQAGDDFIIYTDGKRFWACRDRPDHAFSTDEFKTREECISEAVWIFHRLIEESLENMRIVGREELFLKLQKDCVANVTQN